MLKERSQATFKSREMTYFMDGGESMTKVTFFCMEYNNIYTNI